MKRVEFSKKVRAEAFARSNGCCEACQAKLKVGEAEVDHIVPFYFTQDSSLSNAQVLCKKCHRGEGEKTAQDQKAISKSKRLYLKHNGLWKPAGTKLQSRGFPKKNNR